MASDTVSASVDEAEATLGTRLPESFRRYLLKDGPAEIDILGLSWDLNPIIAANSIEPSRVGSSAIVAETMNARECDGFPNGAVAVGSDGSGNCLVFLPTDRHLALGDALYVWWHEGPELELVANDFSEVLQRSNKSLERTRER